MVCLPRTSAHLHRSTAFSPDGITERVHCMRLTSKSDLDAFIAENISTFTTPAGNGAVLLLYSAILSRGIDKVRTNAIAPAPASAPARASPDAL